MADNILDPKTIDKRTYERYVRNGQLDEKAYDKHVKSLPDVSDKLVSVSTKMSDEDEIEDSLGDDAAE